MSPWKTIIAAAMAVAVCGTACAQDAPAAQPDPARMALAEQLVAASGGSAQITNLLRSMFGAIEKNVSANTTPEASDLVVAMMNDMANEMINMGPQLIQVSERAYARTFTEQELRDLLAFQTSESGKAMVAKMPSLQAEVIAETLPLVNAAMPAIMQKSLDRICEQQHCTAAQRKVVEDAMLKSFHSPAG